MLVRCNCTTYKCKGALVPANTKRNHERADLKNQTVSQQNAQRRLVPSAKPIAGLVSLTFPIRLHDLPAPLSLRFDFTDPPSMSDLPVKQEMLDHGTSSEDLDIPTYSRALPNLGPNFRSPESMLEAVNYYEEYHTRSAAIAQPLTSYLAHQIPPDPEQRQFERVMSRIIEEVQQEQLAPDGHEDQEDRDEEDPLADNADHDDEYATPTGPLLAGPSEDDPDPFVVEHHARQSADIQKLPNYLLVIYVMVSWLHLQFHLPRIACNALLAFLACLLTFFSPAATPPFITLQSATRTLGVDPHIEVLPVCPTCRDVFPSSSSKHMQDVCPTCNIPLFLPDHTKRGNQCSMKTPVIKYPYLSLSDQIESVLKLPGVEALLDDWRTKPRKSGEYGDIFDGNTCRLNLKAPDGTLFFSNLPNEKNGPNSELHIGVNLGIDWYVSYSAFFIWLNLVIGFRTYAATSLHRIHRVPHHSLLATYHPNIGASYLHVSDTPYLIY